MEIVFEPRYGITVATNPQTSLVLAGRARPSLEIICRWHLAATICQRNFTNYINKTTVLLGTSDP